MAASYEYDETGQSGFFVFTFLLLVLIPWTISTLQSGRVKVGKSPCLGWNFKDEQVTKAKSKAPAVNLNYVCLALGWALLAYVGYRASFVEASSGTYDPFSILGISSGLSEKQIKRHFKRLSLKFHPDKLKLEANQTIEEVNEHFVNITKAYKALTDETIRKNYEMYGHPDGKRDTAMGIALPKWIVESQNNAYVIGVYGLVFGFLLPWFVGKWWHGSRKYTKDQVLTESAALYFQHLTEETRFAQAVEVLSASSEFKLLDKRNEKLFATKDFKELEDLVQSTLSSLTGEKLVGKLYNGERHVRRTGTLLYAHMLRIPIKDNAILKAKHTTVNYARHLTTGMQSIALGYNWLSTFLVIVTVQQRLVQAVHPSLSSLLQLPYLSVQDVEELGRQKSITSPEQYVVLTEEEKQKVLPDIQGIEKKRLEAVSEKWPKLELVSSEFKVVGEKIVTPGCVIQFTIKLRIPPPKFTSTSDISEHNAEEPAEQDLKGEEMEMDELLGRKKVGADGEEPSPVAHAPHFLKDRLPNYYLLVGDHKLNRVFVQPIKFSDVGYTKIRTMRTSFQAPQGAGLYTFQAYVVSDSYIGTDVQASMQLRVEPPEALDNEDRTNAEDDISEPDEDTLAGQMAAMRGQPTKKKMYDSDDTSGTESSDDSSESDSDSD